MVLGEALNPKAIKINLESVEKDEVFEELIEELVSITPELDRRVVLQAIKDREAKMSTGVLPGIAVPHGKTDAVSGVRGIIGISREGIEYDSLDGKPVHVVILLLSSPDSSELHLRILKHLARLLENSAFYGELMAQESAQDVYDLVCRYEEELN